MFNHPYSMRGTAGLFLGILLCSLCTPSFAQEKPIPDVIPPSPTAANIQLYGNTPMNLYNGQADISVPIYEIVTGELRVPIALRYTGGAGINVQEMASWAGVGWNLTTGGAVSRTIQGFADDREFDGYYYQPQLPTYFEQSHFDLINKSSLSIIDTEPDKFRYSAPGLGSGSFYIRKKNGNNPATVMQVPQTANIISVAFDASTKKIASFTITNDMGVVYYFDQIESVKTYMVEVTQTTNIYDNSSWYLSEIREPNQINKISFLYVPNPTKNFQENLTTKSNGNIEPIYMVSDIIGIKLDKITSNCGDDIRFISLTGRCDYRMDEMLNRIEIHKNSALVSNFEFYHSYFDRNGVIAKPADCNFSSTANKYKQFDDGNPYLRLKLDSIAQTAFDGVSMPSYKFQYNTSNFLPHRHSFARDHWGYYNGKLDNISPEPRYFKYLPQFMANDEFSSFGSADRTPSVEHAKALTLERIYYPTGGYLELSYEGNSASNSSFPVLVPYQGQVGPTNPTATIQLQASSVPFVEVVFSMVGTQLSNYCNVVAKLKMGATTYQVLLYNGNSGPFPFYSKSIFVPVGTYEVSYQLVDNNNCFANNDFVSLDFKYYNEDSTPNKPVGGLRIKRIKERASSGSEVVREYQYTLEDGITSSGYLAELPNYGYALLANTAALGSFGDNGDPVLWRRTMSSNYPILQTSSAFVGYGRVTETHVSEVEGGKTVYFYTNPEKIKNVRYGSFNGNTSESFIWQGQTFLKWIPSETNDSDWARGQLRGKITYKKVGNVFKMVKRESLSYRIFFSGHPHIYGTETYLLDSNNQNMLPEATILDVPYPTQSLHSLKASCANTCFVGVCETSPLTCTFIHVRLSNLYFGRLEHSRTVTETFDDVLTAPFRVVTENTYDPTYYTLKSTKVTDSKGTEQTTQYYHIPDYLSSGIAGTWTTPESDALLAMKNKNIVNKNIFIEQKAGTAVKSWHKYHYAAFNGKHQLSRYSASFNGGTLQNQLDFIKYSTTGRPEAFIDHNSGIESRVQYNLNNQPLVVCNNCAEGEQLYHSFKGSGSSSSSPYAGDGDRPLTAQYDLTGLIQPINGQKYLIDYWWKPDANGAWQRVLEPITFTAGMQVKTSKSQGYIDELRFYPADAQMMTYNYNDRDRLVAICDANNQATKYGYDSFGRLIEAKDENDDLVQTLGYRIKGGNIPIESIISLSGSLDFGTVKVGNTATRTVTVTNTGNGVLTITAISLPTNYTANWTSNSVNPGASVQLTITYAPNNFNAHNGNLVITNNSVSGNNTLSITGQGSKF